MRRAAGPRPKPGRGNAEQGLAQPTCEPGGGGGRPDLAQAGGPDGAGVEAALKAIGDALRSSLSAALFFDSEVAEPGAAVAGLQQILRQKRGPQEV